MIDQWTRNLTLRQLLLTICMTTAGVGILTATGVMMLLGMRGYTQNVYAQLRSLTHIVAANSEAPMQFEDADAARETLASLGEEQGVVYACTLGQNGGILAEFRRSSNTTHKLIPPREPRAHIQESAQYLDAFQPIVLDGKQIGTVGVRYDLADLRTAIRQQMATALAVFLVAMIIAYLLVSKLRHAVLRPLAEIIETTQEIRTTNDYAVRAKVVGMRHELGSVVDAFNAMLSQIEMRDHALRSANEDLEARVDQRTEALKEQIDTNANGIVVVDADGRIQFLNPATEGFLASDAKVGAEFPWGLPDSHDEVRTAVLPGEDRTAEYSCAPTLWDELPATLVTIQDISHRRSLERQLLQAQKMEAIGRLAGGIAHDFNNLLTAILGYSDLLLDSLPAGSEQRGDAEVIRRAADRARALTRQLLTFSRRQVVQLRVLNVNDVVTDSDKILRRLIGENIELVTILGDAAPCVEADAGLLEQVLMNLVVNARDAMAGGGKITVTVSRVTIAKGEIVFRGSKPGSYICLSVTDTGCGMEEGVAERIFEPFFTTKGVGEGTGLGLSTVYGIVSELHGGIDLESNVGEGTTFRIYLPTASRAAVPVDTVVLKRDRIIGGAVLVVEDEEIVRQLVCSVLKGSGFVVYEAINVDEAQRVLDMHGESLQLVITDVVMPGRSGRELSEYVEANHPNLPVLFMSGHTDDLVLKHGISQLHHHFLQKPFTAAGLLNKVAEVMSDSQSKQTLRSKP